MKIVRCIDGSQRALNMEHISFRSDDDMEVRLVDFMGDDLSVVEAARVSTHQGLKGEKKDRALIAYLAENDHMTPFEHVVAKLYIKCPLCIAVQILRHRTFSYNMLSRRYTSRDISFFTPTVLRTQNKKENLQGTAGELDPDVSEKLLKEIQNFYEEAHHLYKKLIDMGVAREQARFVLPQGVFTEFYMTGNLRNFMHFVELRLDAHAQMEAQWIAMSVLKVIFSIAPVSVSYLFKRVRSRLTLSDPVDSQVRDLIARMEKEVMR